MFVSYPQYELPYPLLFEEPDARYWRVMALNVHTPWFLLSVEHLAPDEPDMTFVRTLCIGWEYDLLETLRVLEPSRVKGLVCMLPAWQSDTGQWSAREIREVWLRGDHAVLVDAVGERFEANPILEPVSHVKLELLFRVASLQPGQRGQSGDAS